MRVASRINVLEIPSALNALHRSERAISPTSPRLVVDHDLAHSISAGLSAWTTFDSLGSSSEEQELVRRRLIGEGFAMGRLDASEISALLVEYGRRLALRGADPYRWKAYIKAANNLVAFGEP